MINRQFLSDTLRVYGPIAAINAARMLRYERRRYSNGVEVIIDPADGDTIHAPSYSMRQAQSFERAWSKLPLHPDQHCPPVSAPQRR